MRILLNEREMAALTGLTDALVRFYVMALRPRMNFRTGTVGIGTLISWQALTEWMYVEPHVGRKGGSPTRWAVMRMARGLAAAGLLKIVSNVKKKQLIFEFPLALAPHSVSNKAAHQAAQGLPSGKEPKPHTKPQHIGGTTVLRNKQYHHNVQSTYKDAALWWWPEGLSEAEKRAIMDLLVKAKLNGSAQIVLDELSGAMKARGVDNKLGWLRRVIETVRAGTFQPERALQVQKAREQRKATAASNEAAAARPVDPVEIEKGRAALAKIRDSIKRGKKSKG